MSLCKRFLQLHPSITHLLFSTATTRVPKVVVFNVSNTVNVFRHIATTKSHLIATKDNENVLHISEACAKQLKKVAGQGEFLRLSVEGGGCSGFSYKFELDKEIQDDDVFFERDGVQVVSDEDSLNLIKGSTVDYEVELIKSAFCVKDNPQSSMKCSCGVSFSID